MLGVRITFFGLLALTGCAVATGPRTPAPIASSSSAGFIGLPRIGGAAAGDHASGSGPRFVGAGSFPRSFQIPGTDTSIRLGG
jgi:hypothetical protein